LSLEIYFKKSAFTALNKIDPAAVDTDTVLLRKRNKYLFLNKYLFYCTK
jgi:hypothetical protein